MKNNKFWNISYDLLEKNPRDVIKDILEHDKANYEKASKDLLEEIELLDCSMSLFIMALQGAHQRIEIWKNDESIRTGMAMAEAVFNYALLARHSVLLGYISEVEALFRSCWERETRAFLFFNSRKMAIKFLEGKEINQDYVDREIRKLESKDKEKELYDSLRAMYRNMCNVVHPNIESFKVRYGEEKKLKEKVGLIPCFGGLLNDSLAKALINRVIRQMIFILKVLRMKFEDDTGKWDKEFNRICENSDALLDKLISEVGIKIE